MKYLFILISVVILSICGCRSKYIADRNLVEDPRFEHWFQIRGLGGDVDDGKNQAVFPSSELNLGKPSWTITQWGSKYNFADPRVTEKKQLTRHSFQLKNSSKRFTVDSQTGELEMGLFASACYTKPRLVGERWPHLQISTQLTDTRVASGFHRVQNIRTLNLNVNSQLLDFRDNHPNPDPELHAARFLVQIVVQNLTKDDDGFGDMLWFEIPIFDNRHELIPEFFQKKGVNQDVSDHFTFSLGHTSARPKDSVFFKGGKIESGTEREVVPTRVELIPWIHYAFQLARKHGYMKTTSFRDLHLSVMNIGWEMSGNYDGVMKISDLSLIAEY